MKPEADSLRSGYFVLLRHFQEISPFLTSWLRDAPTSLTFNNCTFCPHSIYVFCKQRLNATYSINGLVFITEMKSVYSAVRTGPLNKAVCSPSLKG
jgi:hypothetical protein